MLTTRFVVIKYKNFGGEFQNKKVLTSSMLRHVSSVSFVLNDPGR